MDLVEVATEKGVWATLLILLSTIQPRSQKTDGGPELLSLDSGINTFVEVRNLSTSSSTDEVMKTYRSLADLVSLTKGQNVLCIFSDTGTPLNICFQPA